MNRIFLRIFLHIASISTILILAGCAMEPSAVGGDAGEGLIYLAPGDVLQLDDKTMVYVDNDGILQGVEKSKPIAVGRKARDVMTELSKKHRFDEYSFVKFGKRYVDVAGTIPRSGRYEIPMDEDWSMMNLMMEVEAITSTTQNKEFFLIRPARQFPGSYLFLRGEISPEWGGIGGDDLLIQSQDVILFPGNKFPVYIFGAVAKSNCFTFEQDSNPTLAIALEQAGNFSAKAKKDTVYVYRVLKHDQISILTLSWPREQSFKIEPWDIIYIP